MTPKKELCALCGNTREWHNCEEFFGRVKHWFDGPAKPEPVQDRAREIAEDYISGPSSTCSALAEAIRAYGDERAKEVLACHDCREFRAVQTKMTEAALASEKVWANKRADALHAALMAARTDVASEKERAEKAEAKRKRLQDAVNDSDEPCLPGCDSYAHEEECPHVSMAASLSKLHARAEAAEAEVARLNSLVTECEAEHPPEPEYLAWQAAGKPDVAEVSRLREVLRALRNEAHGMLAIERAGIVELVSETNVRCLEFRIAGADEALKEADRGQA
jgi:hypothetical protein